MTSFHLPVERKKQTNKKTPNEPTKQKRNRLIDKEKLVVTRGEEEEMWAK